MKIRIEFDLTPEEFRDSLGLPNIAGLQDEALAMLKKRLSNDVQDVDMTKIVQSWLSQGMAASRKIQEMLASAAAGVLDPDARPGAGAPKGKKEPSSRARRVDS